MSVTIWQQKANSEYSNTNEYWLQIRLNLTLNQKPNTIKPEHMSNFLEMPEDRLVSGATF